MSPLQISILLHYYVSPTDFRDGDFSAPAVKLEIDEFVSLGLLQPINDRSRKYRLTDGVRVYVEHLMEVPLPVQRWIIPEEEKTP